MMEEYSEREAVFAEIENLYKNAEKIKTSFAKIIVDGTVKKPYYSILWLDRENKGCNVGYSSYCLDYVFKWLEEVFELVDADEPLAVDAVEVVRCKDCKHLNAEYCCNNWRGLFDYAEADDYCSYGERREEDGSTQSGIKTMSTERRKKQ